MTASKNIWIFCIINAYRAYKILAADTSTTSNSFCLKIDCEDAVFSNLVKSVMTSSCNQCFLSNYSICINLKRSANQASKFTFCDHKLPPKCKILRNAIDGRNLKEHSNYLCSKNICKLCGLIS
uniref:Uncharacterized protein n=1 Tax=Romanomermis culicivorax TaxID=13658 RepID=A0A915KXM1_ROMCU